MANPVESVLRLVTEPDYKPMTLKAMSRRFHVSPDDYAEFREGYLRLHRIRTQIGFYQALKNLMRTWRMFHASLAGFLVVAIAAHIAVSLYLGYGWRR